MEAIFVRISTLTEAKEFIFETKSYIFDTTE